MSLLGIDLGSGSCKGVAFGVDGAILARAERSYSTYTDAPGSVLMDPENMWNAAVEVINKNNAFEKINKDDIIDDTYTKKAEEPPAEEPEENENQEGADGEEADINE